MQIKDRHNGNILVDEAGHLVHIDFGFMLSNSPGGVNFEAAPFKLTRELLQVMDSDSDGRASELFDYFKVVLPPPASSPALPHHPRPRFPGHVGAGLDVHLMSQLVPLTAACHVDPSTRLALCVVMTISRFLGEEV